MYYLKPTSLVVRWMPGPAQGCIVEGCVHPWCPWRCWWGGGGRVFLMPILRLEAEDRTGTLLGIIFLAFLHPARKVNPLPLKRSQTWGAKELLSQAPKHRRSNDNLPVLEPASPYAAPLVHACPAQSLAGRVPSRLIFSRYPGLLGGLTVPLLLLLPAGMPQMLGRDS